MSLTLGFLLTLISYAMCKDGQVARMEKLTAKSFSDLLKSPNDCLQGSCPSGAYYVEGGNSSALYSLGTVLGGPQSTLSHGMTDQWTNTRYAILIGEGTYQMPGFFKLGYYMQAMGVSADVSSVVVSPGINVLNDCEENGDPDCIAPGGLNNFWRSMSSLRIDATDAGEPLFFAVSQASPMRNVELVGQSLLMCDPSSEGCGYTSGGFISQISTTEEVILGSQQQFYITGSSYSNLAAGAWNIVSHNNEGTHSGTGDSSNKNQWDGYPFTILNEDSSIFYDAPRIILSSGVWYVEIAANTLSMDNFIILSLENDVSPTVVSKNTIDQINSALDSSYGLIVMPGIYELEGVIHFPDNKIMLGVGIPSLICQSSSGKCMVTSSEGVRISGITFSAGTTSSALDSDNVLLTVGDVGEGKSNNPVVLQDVYCRVARTTSTQASPSTNTCVMVNANHVIGENLWLWRADHDDQASVIPFDIDQAQHGLVVLGNNVIMNGLFVEHFRDYQTVWLGKNGRILFYQSEMPYVLPVDQYPDVVNCTYPGSTQVDQEQVCASLYVTANATGFEGYGLGVYSYFPNVVGQQTVVAKSGIKIDSTDATITHALTHWLNGDPLSGIESIIVDANGVQCPSDSQISEEVKGYCISQFSQTCD